MTEESKGFLHSLGHKESFACTHQMLILTTEVHTAAIGRELPNTGYVLGRFERLLIALKLPFNLADYSSVIRGGFGVFGSQPVSLIASSHQSTLFRTGASPATAPAIVP